MYFAIPVPLKYGLIRGSGLWWKGSYKRGITVNKSLILMRV